uniref:DUF8039 domain-containing protein n=1 Tax=Cannabis sativa TaxID=3483 RepID=A0A803QQC1_CANSA
MNKYNHKLGRGGYVRAEAELEKQLGHELNGFDRADLWSRARTDNKGELSEDAKKIKQKIDHYRELQEKGEWEPQGFEDVLTKALGTPEERGRVRGVGFGVTSTQFWNTPRPRSSKGKEKQILTSDVEHGFASKKSAFEKKKNFWRGSCGAPSRSNSGEQYQDARGQLIEGCVYVPQPPTSYYVPDPPLEPPPVPERRKCRLAIQSRDNIVALGFHLNTRPNDFNVDMGDIDCHVTIQHPIQGAAPLPYPMVDMDVCVVSQATGVVMAWPKHLVIFHDWTDQDALITKSRHSATPLTQQQQEPTRRIREPLSQEVQQPVIRGHNLNEVYKIISTWPDKANVKVSIERHIFDLDMSGLYILKEDILDFIFNKKIGQGIITCYMRYIT